VTPREKVAIAIARVLEKHGILIVGDGCISELGGAAIEAMREPTKEMWERGLEYFPFCEPERGDLEALWRRLIDAALEEKP